MNVEILERKDEMGLQPIHYAAAEGKERALAFLLEKGVEINVGKETKSDSTTHRPIHLSL